MLIPSELEDRIRALPGSPLNEAQWTIVNDTYRRNPVSVEQTVGKAEGSERPTAYFVFTIKKISVEELNRPAPVALRHDLDPVACLDCGDTGFVTLKRDLGPDAQAGDVAACHCSAGQAKLAKQNPFKGSTGTPVTLPNAPLIHYGMDDFEPAVPDPEAVLMSLRDYANSPAGQSDPNLEAMRRRYRMMREMP